MKKRTHLAAWPLFTNTTISNAAESAMARHNGMQIAGQNNNMT